MDKLNFNLNRFIKMHEKYYKTALNELRNGKKQTHWMWYIFPQIKGLGKSSTAMYYAIENIDEAKEFLNNDYLREDLIRICNVLLEIENNDITDIMGFPDDLKLCSSMTLFYTVSKDVIFKQVLDKYFDSKLDEKTLDILEKDK